MEKDKFREQAKEAFSEDEVKEAISMKLLSNVPFVERTVIAKTIFSDNKIDYYTMYAEMMCQMPELQLDMNKRLAEKEDPEIGEDR